MTETTAGTADGTPGARRTVALVTLGCARNDVDSEELAARLAEGGYELVEEAAEAEAVLVNTCGFVEAAKKDSVDTLLSAVDGKQDGNTQAVIAVGCMAERYGEELATAMPETDAVLGFDDYADIAERVEDVLGGRSHVPHTPQDRRTLLPITPVDRAGNGQPTPGHATAAPDLPDGLAPASGPRVHRRRLGGGPVAPLKLASGCDRRCTFCAIPRFRGAFVSRPGDDVVAEAEWLAQHDVHELFLVSENSTSYGKDLGDLRLLEQLLPRLAAVDGIARVRVSYLQPAEMRPGLVQTMTDTAGVAPYFDLSFQHSSASVLRRMRRFGDTDRFLALIEQIRARCPHAGIRSNVIVGFPGETEDDVAELERFLSAAQLDVVGVFAYSDEDNTEAATFTDKVAEEEIQERYDRISGLVEELVAQRAEDRIGDEVDVLVEQVDEGEVEGRATHQGPDVDGSTVVRRAPDDCAVGSLIHARVVGSDGADLIAEAVAAGASEAAMPALAQAGRRDQD